MMNTGAKHKQKSGCFFIACMFSLALVACASPPPGGSPVKTVAVWNIENLTPAGDNRPDVGEILSATIIEAIEKKGDYTVIERERLLLALEELNLGTSAVVDQSTQLELGRMLGAQWMVFGGYQVIAQQMRIDLRLVEVETGKIVNAVSRMAYRLDTASWINTAEEAALELF